MTFLTMEQLFEVGKEYYEEFPNSKVSLTALVHRNMEYFKEARWKTSYLDVKYESEMFFRGYETYIYWRKIYNWEQIKCNRLRRIQKRLKEPTEIGAHRQYMIYSVSEYMDPDEIVSSEDRIKFNYLMLLCAWCCWDFPNGYCEREEINYYALRIYEHDMIIKIKDSLRKQKLEEDKENRIRKLEDNFQKGKITNEEFYRKKHGEKAFHIWNNNRLKRLEYERKQRIRRKIWGGKLKCSPLGSLVPMSLEEYVEKQKRMWAIGDDLRREREEEKKRLERIREVKEEAARRKKIDDEDRIKREKEKQQHFAKIREEENRKRAEWARLQREKIEHLKLGHIIEANPHNLRVSMTEWIFSYFDIKSIWEIPDDKIKMVMKRILEMSSDTVRDQYDYYC